MRDALKSYLTLAAGVGDLTRQRALTAAKALVSQGEATADQVTGLAEDLVAQTRQNREAVAALVGFEVDRVLGKVGLASADEVTSLLERVRALEAQVRTLSAAGAEAKAEAAPVEKAPAEQAAAEKAPAEKAPAEKAPAKKAPAKKAPAETVSDAAPDSAVVETPASPA